MSSVVSSRERKLKEPEHGLIRVDGEAIASKRSRMVRGESRRDVEMENVFRRPHQVYEVVSDRDKGKHSIHYGGSKSKTKLCKSSRKLKSKKSSKSTKSYKSYKLSKMALNSPYLCKNCWCDAGGDKCPRFDLVARYKGVDIAFFRELGQPNNYNDSASQVLCYPNLGNLPKPFNNRSFIPIPFLPSTAPLCKNVPNRISSNPNAVCAFRYRDDNGDIIDTDYCSCRDGYWQEKVASYDMVSYPNRKAALAKKTFITHKGGKWRQPTIGRS